MSTLPYVFGSEPVKDSTQLNANFDSIMAQIGAVKSIKNVYYTSSDSVNITADSAYHDVLSLVFTPSSQLYHLIIAKYYKYIAAPTAASINVMGKLLDVSTTLDITQQGIVMGAGGVNIVRSPVSFLWYGQLSSAEHTIHLQDMGFSGDTSDIAYYAKLVVVQFSF